jgi:hypothetical protein
VTESVHRLSYGGMGATEFRILVGIWSLVAATFLSFVDVVRNDLSRLRRLEPIRGPIASAPGAALDGNLGQLLA